MKKGLILTAIMLLSIWANANVIVVTNKNNTGAGSLRNAVLSAASSDTIRFLPALISGGSDTIKLASEIIITNDIVIIGLYNSSDTLCISGQNLYRIFNFQGSSLVLDSLVLINGRASNGGAIYCYSSPAITVSNSFFRDNVATAKGGAAYFEYGDITLTNTVFENNSATSDGGALYCLNAQSITAYKTDFYNNTTGTTGGAMYLGGGGSSVFSFLRSVISGNSSTYDGGALYCKGRYFNMDSTKVEYNSATGGIKKSIVSFGGLNRFDIYIDNSEISNNTGLGISAHISLGVSVNTESKMYCNRCTFFNNSNGGVYSEVFADNANSSSILEVNYSTVANNGGSSTTCGGIFSTAWGFGSGFSFNSNVKVKNSTIVNNTNNGNGSGIFSQGKLAASSYLEVKSSIVANNSGVNLYSFSSASSITSQGNNIFSNSTVIGSVASDQLGVTIAGLNLGSLGNNGGFTKTMRPNTGSVAIDLGNISDLSNAQNGPISGRRDIGSTEWIECTITHSYSQTLCYGDSVLFNSIYLKTPGVYTQTYIDGSCDSVVTLNLSINPPVTSTQTLTLCSGESITVGSNTYSATGTYTDVLTAVNGCDSTVTTNLTVNPAITSTQTLTLCSGQSITIGSNTYSTTGTYTDVLTAASGCDSTVTTNLTINPAIANSQTLTLCSGESITVGSNTYSTTGTYTDVLTAVNGCDSTVTTNLTVNPAISSSQTLTLCAGQSITVGSNTYSSTGTYTDVLIAANGCDSTVTTNLTVNPEIDITTSLFENTIMANEVLATYQWIDCDNYYQPILGEIFHSFTATENGNYAVVITQNSCSDTSSCVSISTVNINGTDITRRITIFPNPTNSTFTISGAETNSSVCIYNSIGELLTPDRLIKTSATFDLSDYPEGVYYIMIKTDSIVSLQKLVKSKQQ
ncbi:MAG: hypothetical protein A2281_18095 [Bacteroidetes bacterium RIFOXYA12_FULL_38_20]|nr:MAG: hypothetical protein A2281_18095 [Bacteroidetes bacterium RIFOXYA12_FULL_38_20]